MELNMIDLTLLSSSLTFSLVFTLNTLQTRSVTNKSLYNLFAIVIKAGWLIPVAIATAFVSLWIVNIVIPTLKGADFNLLYDFYNIRYLDIALVSVVCTLTWLAVNNVKAALLNMSALL